MVRPCCREARFRKNSYLMICRYTRRPRTAATHRKSTAARIYSLLLGVLAAALPCISVHPAMATPAVRPGFDLTLWYSPDTVVLTCRRRSDRCGPPLETLVRASLSRWIQTFTAEARPP